MKRKSGFYWIRLGYKWLVALYDESKDLWYIPGKNGGITSDMVSEFNENRLKP
jgi:hypothetical protein